MNSNEIEKLKIILSSILEIDISSVNENLVQINLTNWDSLKHLNLILTIEEEFGINIPDENIPNLISYKTIYNYLNEVI